MLSTPPNLHESLRDMPSTRDSGVGERVRCCHESSVARVRYIHMTVKNEHLLPSIRQGVLAEILDEEGDIDWPAILVHSWDCHRVASDVSKEHLKSASERLSVLDDVAQGSRYNRSSWRGIGVFRGRGFSKFL